MKEEFLYFVWSHQIFQTENLKTKCGQEITLLDKGTQNHNQGPDFLNAKIKIGSETLYGNIEFHIKNGEWYSHKHDKDSNFNTVILHIILEETDEVNVTNQLGTTIPILCLKDYIEPETILNYEYLKSQKSSIPCSEIFEKPDDIYINKFKEKLLVERLIDKSQRVKKLLIENNNDLETTFYQSMLYSFGLKVNAEPFLNIAKSIPLSVLGKVNDDILALESILLGQAKLLDSNDEYCQKLKKEYEYYQKLYSLEPIQTKVLFSKMLPSSFPTIRLSQFAAFVYKQKKLYSKLTSFSKVDDLYQYFDIEVSEYWETHYNFTSSHSPKAKKLSKSFIYKTIINTVLPFIFLTKSQNDEDYNEVIEHYSNIPKETNKITKNFHTILDIKNKNSFDSQSIIQWNNNYCEKKRCLECPIGLKTIR